MNFWTLGATVEYGEVVDYFLKKRGMSPAELARKIGSPRSTVNAWLNDHAKAPTLEKAKAVADALGVSLDEMAEMAFGDNGQKLD